MVAHPDEGRMDGVFPNVLFERQQALGLDPLDINILLHIASIGGARAASRIHPK